jgi:uncharacterized Ntn-hydrolase superfamily protein
MTYSIVAFDKKSKQYGVGVQTHQPSVGAVVPWVRSGVGAVATQSLTNISFGPLGIEMLASGMAAEKVLAALIASDESEFHRQVAVVDIKGKAAAHSGAKCIPFFGHHVGEGYSVQANMMLKDTVPAAMSKAFEGAKGSLMERIMQAMEAAEAEGGDIRGSQSAAIVVYGSDESKQHWENRVADLRVDEHADPVGELRRIVDLKAADLLSRKGDEQAEAGDIEKALKTYARARQLSKDASEMAFWQALTLADEHDMIEEARNMLAPLFEAEPNWRELVRRLENTEILDHPEVVGKLLGE